MRLRLLVASGAAVLATVLLPAAGVPAAAPPAVPAATTPAAASAAAASPSGPGGGPARRVVVIAIDNTHLADVERMPALTGLFSSGTLFASDHTGLPAYTHADYVTAATGDYPDRTGIVSQFQFDGGQGVSFSYWPDRTPAGLAVHLSPPPWAYWNGLGDSVGVVGWADMALESTGELGRYGVSVAAGKKPENYLAYTLHNADGSTVFGAPNLPQVEHAPLLLSSGRTVGDFSGAFDANFGPDRSLTAAAALLIHGTDVVYDYIRSVHNTAGGASLMPGTAAYAANLARYNAAFTAFFARLARHGITPANTVFLLTSDEGDHFSPGGAITTGLRGRLSRLGFSLSGDHLVASTASMLYWPAGTGEPLARLAGLPGWRYLAGRQVLRAIHAEPADGAYGPSLVIFAQPDWSYGGGSGTAITTEHSYWNHGTVARDINSLWIGLAGPGVPAGRVSREWVDSADILPTLQRLVTGTVQPGLEGLPMVDAFRLPSGLPPAERGGGSGLRSLTVLYKQLDAPLGAFSRALLQAGTTAVVEPPLRTELQGRIASLIARRQAVAAPLHRLLRQVESGRTLNPAAASHLATLAAAARSVLSAARQTADRSLLR